MIYRTTTLFLALLLFVSVNAQDIVWADTVIAFSSQKSGKAFSAQQSLYKPSRFPNPGHTTCAWSPDVSATRIEEYLIVGFSQDIRPEQLIIVENYNPGFIKQIFVYDESGHEINVYERKEIIIGGAGRLFKLPLNHFEIRGAISKIKIILDQAPLNNTYQIDAIGISSSLENPDIALREVIDTTINNSERLSDEINTTSDEVYPVISPNGSTLYFDRKAFAGNMGEKHTDDIWISTSKAGKWQAPINAGPPLNDDDVNFLCSISPDGNTALLGNLYGNENDGVGVSLSVNSGNGWGLPTQLKIDNFNNLNQYNEFSLASDGTTLVMTIETEESLGLLDLYVSFLSPDGSFSKPRHMGRQINTAGNEMTPFLAADGKTLYFSSNGFPGYGSQDIFISKRLDDSWTNWSEPINLGSKVNTSEWEAYYTIDAKGEFAYFSSSFTTGTNLDIFRIPIAPDSKPEDIIWLKGLVTDKLSGIPIASQVTAIATTDSTRAGISASTSQSGYALILHQNFKYQIRIESPGYYSADTILTTPFINREAEIIQNFSLIPKRNGVIIEMKNILFKVNSDVLEDTSFAGLNKVVYFLKENPEVKIEVRGHTNGLCDDNYCNSLSQRRAETVMKYFINAGIEASRLSSHGYGKTLPIADNKTTEGRKRNQRVEFMITQTD